MMFILLAVILVAVWFIAQGGRITRPGEDPVVARETPEQILEKRFAKGEISRDEYLQSKDTLRSN